MVCKRNFRSSTQGIEDYSRVDSSDCIEKLLRDGFRWGRVDQGGREFGNEIVDVGAGVYIHVERTDFRMALLQFVKDSKY